jgi:hypothetical protein
MRIARADLELKERILDPRDESCLYPRNIVGQDLCHLRRYRQSSEWNKSLMKDLADSIHYTIVLQTAAALGSSYNRLEKYQNSLDLCTKAMARFDSTFTGESPEILALYTVIGESLPDLKRPTEASAWARKALLGGEKIYGTAHSVTLCAMEYLAQNYAELKDFKKVYSLQEQCVKLMKESLGANHPHTIYAGGGLVDLINQRKMNLPSRKKVIGHRRALLEKTREQYGERDWRTLACQSQLAQDYLACASFEKSKLMQEKLVEVLVQEFEKDDKRTIEGIVTPAQT